MALAQCYGWGDSWLALALGDREQGGAARGASLGVHGVPELQISMAPASVMLAVTFDAGRRPSDRRAVRSPWGIRTPAPSDERSPTWLALPKLAARRTSSRHERAFRGRSVMNNHAERLSMAASKDQVRTAAARYLRSVLSREQRWRCSWWLLGRLANNRVHLGAPRARPACGVVSPGLGQAVPTVTHILVITSCTGDKAAVGHPGLQLSDFQDPERLKRGEERLRDLMLPAGLMYTGQQHVRAMAAVKLLREILGADAVKICIVSAGYGVLDEDQLIAPYDVTFSGMPRSEARRWARQIGAADGIRARLPGHNLVIVLLGSSYLEAVDPPLPVADGQRIIYFAKEAERRRLTRTAAVLVLAGARESTRYRMGLIGLKGRMLELFAQAVAREGQPVVDEVCADGMGSVMTAILEREVTRS
jgi:hypothetical protein